MADPECKTNIRAQRSFASVAQLGSWLELMTGAEGLVGERGGVIDIERASATWSTSSFTSYHGQLLSLAVQWGVAIEIERAIKKSARFC